MAPNPTCSPRGGRPPEREPQRRLAAALRTLRRLGRPLASMLAVIGWLGAAAPPPAGADDTAASPGGPEGLLARAQREPGDPAAGAATWQGCAVCHGPDGVGRSDGTFPRLAGQHASVVLKQIVDIREGRRGNPIMASHIDALTDPREMADVAAFVEALSAPPRSAPGGGPGSELGRDLYQRDCTRCHGALGEGDAASAVPVVAGQHEAYLLRQLRAIAGALRRNAHPAMVDIVFEYRDEELRALARHLASLPWPERAEGTDGG